MYGNQHQSLSHDQLLKNPVWIKSNCSGPWFQETNCSNKCWFFSIVKLPQQKSTRLTVPCFNEIRTPLPKNLKWNEKGTHYKKFSAFSYASIRQRPKLIYKPMNTKYLQKVKVKKKNKKNKERENSYTNAITRLDDLKRKSRQRKLKNLLLFLVFSSVMASFKIF